MTVKVSKPAINVREELADLRKPSGTAGEAMLRAETPQEQFQLIGAGRRNLIINGAMQVAQRGTSVTGLGNTATYATCDRWEQQASAATGRYTSTQTGITDLVGFRSCLKFNCTTADTSTGAGEYLILAHKFEGFNVSHIGMGSSEAKELTLSFYAKGNAPAQYTAQFQTAQSYEVSKSFNVTSEWQRFEITYPANTVANPLDNNNTGQLFLQIWLNSGSTYSGGSALNETWGNPANNTMAVGNSNFYSSTDNEFFITGVQLELGKVATPFEHRSYGEELALCQRYFQKQSASGSSVYERFGMGFSNTSTNFNTIIPIQTPMRATPALGHNGTMAHYHIYHNAGTTTPLTGISIDANADGGSKQVGVNAAVSSGLVAGGAGMLNSNNNATAFISLDAEL